MPNWFGGFWLLVVANICKKLAGQVPSLGDEKLDMEEYERLVKKAVPAAAP